jgi:hypothetical protein
MSSFTGRESSDEFDEVRESKGASKAVGGSLMGRTHSNMA